MSEELCDHLLEVHDVTPLSKRGCEECLQRGDRWVHLRLCMECGNVGCCDDSKNKHASKHSRASGHPVVRSIEPGEKWLYCYADDLFFDPD
jgi:CPA2 family monovalent cation:H+ antiporter-2